MATERNLTKSRQFRYRVEAVASAIAIACMVLGLLHFVLLGLGVWAYFENSPIIGWQTAWMLYWGAIALFVIFLTAEKAGNKICDISERRDNGAMSENRVTWSSMEKA